MAEISNSRNRSPLAEATNRINASTTTVEPQGQKPLLQVNSAPIGAHMPQSSSATDNSSQSETNMASNPPPPTVLKPPHEDGQSNRLSQASYESNSSGRSKRNYKTHIGPWQLGKTLGKGSSARVRLCRHNITNQLAAVKIVNRRMAYLVQDSSLAALSKWDSSMPEKVDGEIRVPMAIEREVAILKLIEHPHIMKIYDIWENRSEM
jgi:serine/threonine-protein kinase HSL1, negative regulator of Swe1 kinase